MACENCHGRMHDKGCSAYLRDGTYVCLKCYDESKQPSSTTKVAAAATSPYREFSPRKKCTENNEECGNCRVISTSLPSYCVTGGRLCGQKCNKCGTAITPEFMKKIHEIYYCTNVGNKKPGQTRCNNVRCKQCADVNRTPEARSGTKKRGNLRSNPKKRKRMQF